MLGQLVEPSLTSLSSQTISQGWNTSWQLVPRNTFQAPQAIRGSVASYKAGNLDYDVGTSKDGKLSEGELNDLVHWSIGLETAGFCSIPIREFRDLRDINPTVLNHGYLYT